MDPHDVVGWQVELLDGRERYRTVVIGKNKVRCGNYLLLQESLGHYPEIVGVHRQRHTAEHRLTEILMNPFVVIIQTLLPSENRNRFFVALVIKKPKPFYS